MARLKISSADIVDLAKAYAYRLRSINRATGQPYSTAEAREYIRTAFGNWPESYIRRAVYDAQRAMEIGNALATMRLEQLLSESLEGKRPPARTVGVHVKVTFLQKRGRGIVAWRVNDLYVEARWDDTLQSVYNRALHWAETRTGASGEAAGVTVQFAGPTLWSNYTPGLNL